MSDEDIDTGENRHNPPLEYYPFILKDENGVEYNINSTVCIKFLGKQIKINGDKPMISDGKFEEMEIPISCRVRVLETVEGKHIVVIEDDVFHLSPLIVPMLNNKYTYNVFADAVHYCKDLGYEDLFQKGRYREQLESNMNLIDLKYKKWWVKQKEGRINV